MIETYEEIELFNKNSTEFTSKLIKTMLEHHLSLGDAISFLAGDQEVEVIELTDADILDEADNADLPP